MGHGYLGGGGSSVAPSNVGGCDDACSAVPSVQDQLADLRAAIEQVSRATTKSILSVHAPKVLDVGASGIIDVVVDSKSSSALPQMFTRAGLANRSILTLPHVVAQLVGSDGIIVSPSNPIEQSFGRGHRMRLSWVVSARQSLHPKKAHAILYIWNVVTVVPGRELAAETIRLEAANIAIPIEVHESTWALLRTIAESNAGLLTTSLIIPVITGAFLLARRRFAKTSPTDFSDIVRSKIA
jgi:hypothetical protein